MRVDTSLLEVADALVSVEVVAPVVLVDPLVAPIVLELDELGDVLDVVLLGDVLMSVEVVLLGVLELLELGLVVVPYVELVPGDDVVSVELVELGLVVDVP